MTTDLAPATVRAVPAAGDELDGRYGADAGALGSETTQVGCLPR